MQFEAGKLVGGRYRLERQLGEGGMGTVWSATHTVTRRSVALKFLKNALAAPNLRARFLREARAATSVRHPNVVEIYDVFEDDDGMPVMVMEFLVGVSLGEHLDRQGKLGPAELARIVLPTISAVGTAHALGIVHRDLKPDNIFLGRDGERTVVKVLDFGIAKVAGSSIGGNLTNTGTLMGTPQYMSPEQAFGESDLDHRADIYSLGIILYECLSGILPTRVANLGQILKLLTLGGIPPLREVAPDVPPPLLDLVERMMSRPRDDRPAHLAEVYDVLAPFAEVEGRAPFGPPSVPLADFDAMPPLDSATAPTEPAPQANVQVTPPGVVGAAASGLDSTVGSQPSAKPARTPAELAPGDSIDATMAAPGIAVRRADGSSRRRAWWLAGASAALVAGVTGVGLMSTGEGSSTASSDGAALEGREPVPLPQSPAVTPQDTPRPVERAQAASTAAPSTAEPAASAAAPPPSGRVRPTSKQAIPAPPSATPPASAVAAPSATASSRTKGLVVQPPF